jgi:CubicO group peptidase (beta-lactamase class C family)
VTLYHLLTHTSGVGDYIDESADRNVEVWPYAMPASDLLTTADYTPLIANRPPEFAAGARFEYCDSGYVLLALIAERATGASFYDLARERVFARAAMKASTFLRGDELPPNAAHGYLTDGRTNIANIPCRGSGDGGAFSTVGDLAAFWSALFAGELVPPEVVDEMVRPRHDVPSERKRYGLGFWLAAEGDRVLLEGYDAGVSFRSAYEPSTELQYTVISNTTDGAWPIVRVLDEH